MAHQVLTTQPLNWNPTSLIAEHILNARHSLFTMLLSNRSPKLSAFTKGMLIKQYGKGHKLELAHVRQSLPIVSTSTSVQDEQLQSRVDDEDQSRQLCELERLTAQQQCDLEHQIQEVPQDLCSHLHAIVLILFCVFLLISCRSLF
ncbi:hypothetical protein P879_12001 [Paragonimus westermani]|uniref:Uncharacterized protein n=1 Tax=Paragonimus westermani TaxID=34504 RepID=A0A8T0D7H3_9TREM|nr:hypothetical protein P879_12001 [Paragonimus westermani]